MGFYFQDDYWDALADLPKKQQDEVAGALTRLFFTGADEPPSKGAASAVYKALRSRVKLAAKKSKPASQGADDADITPTSSPDDVADDPDMNHGITPTSSDSLLLKREREKEKESKKPKERARFRAPTQDEVAAYAAEKDLAIDTERFCDFYESKGWKVGSSPMKDWKAAVRNWARRDSNTTKGGTTDAEFDDLACGF